MSEDLEEERYDYEGRCNENDSYDYFRPPHDNSESGVLRSLVWKAMMRYEAHIGAWGNDDNG